MYIAARLVDVQKRPVVNVCLDHKIGLHGGYQKPRRRDIMHLARISNQLFMEAMSTSGCFILVVV